MKLLQTKYCEKDIESSLYAPDCWVVQADYLAWLILYTPFFAMHILWCLFCCQDSCLRQKWDDVEAAEERHELLQVLTSIILKSFFSLVYA